MTDSEIRDRWFDKVVAQLCAREGVTHEDLDDGRMALEITCNGASRKLRLAGAANDYREQKIEYGRIRKALTELGIEEGQTYVAPKRSRRPLSPEMLAARAKQEKEFNAWQEVWRMIRQAEMALDVEFEISQMLDYY